MMASIEFSEIELDALKEMMNIGFGQAAMALSEVMDMHVILNVPKIAKLTPAEITSFVRGEIGDPEGFSMVEQFFLGRFNGTSFLLLPTNEGEKLVNLFTDDPDIDRSGLALDSLERETIIEVGNIIIGACVGKIAELLKGIVTYQPPRYFSGPVDDALIDQQVSASGCLALVFKTVFHFETEDIYGLLFLVTGEDSASWLKKAVGEMIDGIAT
jgi:chemotaxis protein CheC